MPKPSKLSRIRSAAGRAGAASRWGDGSRATACLRVYPTDAAEIRRRASASGKLPADIIAEVINGTTTSR